MRIVKASQRLRVDQLSYLVLIALGAFGISSFAPMVALWFVVVAAMTPLAHRLIKLVGPRGLSSLKLSRWPEYQISKLPPRHKQQLSRIVYRFVPNRLLPLVENTFAEAKRSTGGAGEIRRLFLGGYEEQALREATRAFDAGSDLDILVEAAMLGLNYSAENYVDFVAKAGGSGNLSSRDLQRLDPGSRALILECFGRHEPALLEKYLASEGPTSRSNINLACVAYNREIRSSGSLVTGFEHLNLALATEGLLPISPDPTGSGWSSLGKQRFIPSAFQSCSSKVGIIVPAHNATPTLEIALNSLKSQTHDNIQVVLVDDRSSDETSALARSIVASDSRFRIVRNRRRLGPYGSRNRGLKELRHCDFITTMDADDWAHPQKIERQVLELVSHPTLVACASGRVNLNEGMLAFPKETLGSFLGFNISSLMFRASVLTSMEGWLPVAFAGDAEFLDRVKTVYGPKSVSYLEIMLSLALSHPSQITRAPGSSGVRRSLGARAEFESLYKQAHHGAKNRGTFTTSSVFADLKPHLPGELLNTDPTGSQELDLDVVIVSDFSFPGGTTTANSNEIQVLAAKGLRVGLVHQPAPKRLGLEVRPVFQQLARRHANVQFLRAGFGVAARLVTVHPNSSGNNALTPRITTKLVKVIAHMTPLDIVTGTRRYDLNAVEESLRERFSASDVIWCPVGPACRNGLRKEGRISLSATDWLSPLATEPKPIRERWGTRDGKGPIVVGRVSRDDFRKWPKGRDKILRAYPPSEGVRVRILGGVESIRARYSFEPPGNWEVFEFGSVAVGDFLQSIEVFVYAIHEDHLEEFGLVVLEAMANGLPVIASPSLEVTFGRACVYFRTENEIPDLVRSLATSPTLRAELDRAVAEYLRRHSGERYLRNLFSTDLECDTKP